MTWLREKDGVQFLDGYALPIGDELELIPFIDPENSVVGYEVKNEEGQAEYIYFNPSSEDTDDPNVFIYQGEEGDPSNDGALMHALVAEWQKERPTWRVIGMLVDDNLPEQTPVYIDEKVVTNDPEIAADRVIQKHPTVLITSLLRLANDGGVTERVVEVITYRGRADQRTHVQRLGKEANA